MINKSWRRRLVTGAGFQRHEPTLLQRLVPVAPESDISVGAQGGNRTHTPNREADFKSVLRNIGTTQYQAKSTIQWQRMVADGARSVAGVWQAKH
jgi:hypothetical protein